MPSTIAAIVWNIYAVGTAGSLTNIFPSTAPKAATTRISVNRTNHENA